MPKKQIDYTQKIQTMDKEKLNRVLIAAIKEFAKGYKQASTDVIVREAGIAKGLLFHYFGSKKNLFFYLHEYAQKRVIFEYFNIIELKQRDILERWRQMSKVRIELLRSYPSIWEFINNANADEKDEAIRETSRNKMAFFQEAYTRLFNDIDYTLFRDDLNVHRALDIIVFTMESYSNTGISEDEFIKGVNDYIRLLRKCFYK